LHEGTVETLPHISRVIGLKRVIPLSFSEQCSCITIRVLENVWEHTDWDWIFLKSFLHLLLMAQG
jgi:hypothetical protein